MGLDSRALHGYSKLHITQLKHLRNQLKAREAKEKSIELRNKSMKDQKYDNYRNEYERLKHELDCSTVHPAQKDKIKIRLRDLSDIFHSSVD